MRVWRTDGSLMPEQGGCSRASHQGDFVVSLGPTLGACLPFSEVSLRQVLTRGQT